VSARCGSSSITQAAVEERVQERFFETLNGQKKKKKLEKAQQSLRLSLFRDAREKNGTAAVIVRWYAFNTKRRSE